MSSDKVTQDKWLSAVCSETLDQLKDNALTVRTEIDDYWTELKKFYEKANTLKETYGLSSLMKSLDSFNETINTEFIRRNELHRTGKDDSDPTTVILRNFTLFKETIIIIHQKSIMVESKVNRGEIIKMKEKEEDIVSEWAEEFLERYFEIILQNGYAGNIITLFESSGKNALMKHVTNYMTALSLISQDIKVYYLEKASFFPEPLRVKIKDLSKRVDDVVNFSSHNPGNVPAMRANLVSNHKEVSRDIEGIYKITLGSVFHK